MNELPRTLYKYFSPDRISILQNMEIYFSRPSDFNDTFDTHYLVPKKLGAKGKVDRFRFKNSLGVFCLTEKPNNHLMWVHYARKHTGFVVGFNATAPFFTSDGRMLDKVIYEDGPRVLRAADQNACFYKSAEWSYEQEWRCVRVFQGQEQRVIAIEPGLITEIVFGSKMETWQIARIMQYVKTYEMTPRFYQSSPVHKSWTIENRPKAVSVCGNCGGDGYCMEDVITNDQ